MYTLINKIFNECQRFLADTALQIYTTNTTSNTDPHHSCTSVHHCDHIATDIFKGIRHPYMKLSHSPSSPELDKWEKDTPQTLSKLSKALPLFTFVHACQVSCYLPAWITCYWITCYIAILCMTLAVYWIHWVLDTAFDFLFAPCWLLLLLCFMIWIISTFVQ